jgi:hypothetical protein
MKITSVVSIIIVTFLLLVGLSVHASAQTANPPKIFLTKSLGNITVSLDTLSGRFAVRCADGRSILFGSEFSNTSHISVKIGKRIYSNYWWIKRSVTPPNVYDLGKGTPEVLNDRLRYTWTVHNRDGDYAITQDLTPTQDTTWNEALVQISVRCVSGKPTTAGVTVQMDINAGGNDKAPITINGNTLRNETVYTGDIVPDAWTVRTPEFGKETITGRLTAPDCGKPDRIVAGNWQTSGDLGIAVYGYGSVGHLIGDGAVFNEWAEKTLDASNEMHVGTRVGLKLGPMSMYFGYDFVLYASEMPSVFINATEPTTIHIHQFNDRWTESTADLNNSWDTTFTIPAGHFNHYHYGGSWIKLPYTDSIQYYQRGSTLIRASRPIGIQGIISSYTTVVCPPLAMADTCFVYPGGHGYGRIEYINATSEDNFVDVMPVGKETYLDRMHVRDSLRNGIRFSWAFTGFGYGRYWTLCTRERSWFKQSFLSDYLNSKDDGAGMLINSRKRGLFYLTSSEPALSCISDTVRRAWQATFVPSVNAGGKEFVTIPFSQNYSPILDLIRLFPFKNNTAVQLSDTSKPVMLSLGEHLDTLISRPMIIKSDKPMAVYQYSVRTVPFVLETDIQMGGVLSLPSTEKWGKRYYSVTGQFNIPEVRSVFPGGDWLPGKPDKHFVRIIRSKQNVTPVTLNGALVNFGNASVVAEYEYVEIQRPPGFDVVESSEPILVVTYGGYGNIGYGQNALFQARPYAYIPLSE